MVPVPPDVNDESGDGRRRLLLLGVIAAIVVVAVAAFLLLHKGSSNSGDTFTPPTHPQPAAAQATGGTATGSAKATSHSPKKGTTLPHKSHTALVRDPFHPLITAPVTTNGATSTGSSQPVTNTTVSPAPVSTAPAVVVQPTSPTTGGVPTTGPATSGSPLWVQLVSVNGTKSAIFDVGYAHHKFRRFEVLSPSPTSTRGTVFDGEFALLGIQGDAVTVQVGDDTPFDLSPRDTHSV
jgi:hypothetical protein